MAAIRRIGKVIEIKKDKIDEYRNLHTNSNPGVRAFISEACIKNFSIYIQKFDDEKYYLFSYYEYTGDDYDFDMARMAERPEIISWLSVTDSMQIPFSGESTWKEMKQVYLNV
jgi:L-rhamnose mutarotase